MLIWEFLWVVKKVKDRKSGKMRFQGWNVRDFYLYSCWVYVDMLCTPLNSLFGWVCYTFCYALLEVIAIFVTIYEVLLWIVLKLIAIFCCMLLQVLWKLVGWEVNGCLLFLHWPFAGMLVVSIWLWSALDCPWFNGMLIELWTHGMHWSCFVFNGTHKLLGDGMHMGFGFFIGIVLCNWFM